MQGAGADAHRHPPTVECGDPEGLGTLAASAGSYPCWAALSRSGRVGACGSASLPGAGISVCQAHGNLSAAPLQGTLVTDATSLAAGGG